MVQITTMKAWAGWPLVRAHLCSLATSVTLHSSIRAPREAWRLGGLQFGGLLTGALVLALPPALLQLALGQLSQQDAVGVWRAVPFFQGVGYLRVLVSFVGCVYTAIHVALTLGYFLYALSSSIPFPECTKLEFTENGVQNIFNASDCLSETFMAPVTQRPEYYISMSLIIVFLWIALPFLLYSPVKLMKRLMYLLGPAVIVLGIATCAGAGSGERLAEFLAPDAWAHLLRPRAWLAAITQALLSTQIAGGFLISAGDSIYSSTNVQWTAVILIGTSIVASWSSLLFWAALGGAGAGHASSSVAVLAQLYHTAEEDGLSLIWPLMGYAALFLSGIITMLTLLYPVYDRIRRSGESRWRVACAGASAVGAALSLAVLAGHETALAAIEDVAVPLLVCLATVLEMLAFILIYGWKALVEDVEFLTGQELSKFWVVGWFLAPALLVPLLGWWLAELVLEGAWSQLPWSASIVAATAAASALVVLAAAALTVARQVQYDIIGKLKASFRASRHWGPRDPITHYYWLARREEGGGDAPRSRYQRRLAGQMAGSPGFLATPQRPAADAPAGKDLNSNDLKRRSNSDDWIYTVCRRKYLEEAFSQYFHHKRSNSLDFDRIPRVKKDSMDMKTLKSTYLTPIESFETVFTDALSDVKNHLASKI